MISQAHVGQWDFHVKCIICGEKERGIALLCQDCNKEFDIKDFDDLMAFVYCGSSAIKRNTQWAIFEIMRLVDEAMLLTNQKGLK